MTGERARIEDELRRAWDGHPWHGPSLSSVLSGVTAAQAAARPLPAAHGIWELVLHLGTWSREVARRVAEGVARMPADADWPAVGDTTEAAWRAALAALEQAHRAVLSALSALPDARLDEVVEDERGAGGAPEVTYAVLLHGLAQHYAYHAGQIALLRKAAG